MIIYHRRKRFPRNSSRNLAVFNPRILNDPPPENRRHLEMSQSSMYASKAYATVANDVAGPRELEARLLLQAAARLQAVHDAWCGKPPGLADAVLYNRRLWIVFIDAVMRDDNQLPIAIRQNILNLGIFVMGETFCLMTRPRPHHLANIIRVNRALAAGLRGKTPKEQPQRTAPLTPASVSAMVA
ncbi:MAG TPA: flagellar biosynthesis regulator FlaF [Xanthobacteraceae bacterium]|nr:flagellar biosynthesis regulator FlaF [Xanthobacteraceae bacterium]